MARQADPVPEVAAPWRRALGLEAAVVPFEVRSSEACVAALATLRGKEPSRTAISTRAHPITSPRRQVMEG